MDSSEHDQVDKSSPETLFDSSPSPSSSDSNDIFGEPLVDPRVGDDYQVEIPSILNNSKLEVKMNPPNSKGVTDSSCSFLIGLPLPVMRICNQANGLTEFKEEPKVKVDAPSQTYSLVPDQSSDPLSESEADCFLLGLYIFGKNFVQVMRFMESKGMGQILAFYYGRFYGSTEYRRWSECRKMRNKKCVIGHGFFTGYRQHELFVRLAPHLSEECRTKFLEVSRAFVEESTSLEEYVFSLKTLVGIHAFVEAVGIGKGKDDLTTLILDTTKNSQHSTHRPEIPYGKAFSSLTCAEIIKYLTGDFRLSKAKSNDLFWEAVWPRLLARGWHSEQPSSDTYPSSKNCLVFLMPGIKNFSRRKLLKGNHYFDSVSDVLAKVANEPELLEIDSRVENGWTRDVKSDKDLDLSDHEFHCYLKPRVSSEFLNLFKFTVVDTSLTNEDNPSKVRIMTSLPFEAKRCSSFKKCSSGRIIKRQRLAPSVEVAYVLGLPATTYKNNNKNVVSLTDKSLTNSSSDVSPGKEKLAQEQKVFDKNLPQIEFDCNVRVKMEVVIEKNTVSQLAESKKSMHFEAQDTSVSHVPVDPSNKGGEPRRQSTRNRPLTIKALEALEIGLLNPVRHSRKRSPLLQEQRPKHSRQLRSKSSMLGNAISVEKAAMSCE